MASAVKTMPATTTLTAMEMFSQSEYETESRRWKCSEMSLGEASASALAEELKDEKCSLEVFTLTNGKLECYSLEEWDGR